MKKNFSSQKLRDAESKILYLGNLCGKEVRSLDDINSIIAEQLGYDKDTVRKWRYYNSTGPGDTTIIHKLESLLNCKLYELSAKESNDISKEYTEYAKANINQGYILMKDYITSEDVDSEDYFECFLRNFEKLRACIPTEVFVKMEDFVHQNFEPIIYQPEKIFPGNNLETDLLKIHGINKLLDEFAEKELNPIITMK